MAKFGWVLSKHAKGTTYFLRGGNIGIYKFTSNHTAEVVIRVTFSKDTALMNANSVSIFQCAFPWDQALSLQQKTRIYQNKFERSKHF